MFNKNTSTSPSLQSLLLAGALLVTSASAFSGTVIDRIKERGQIRIGYRETTIPFSYLDGAQKPVGYSLDLCQKISGALKKQLGIKTLDVLYVPVTSANRIAMIEEGKVDLECGTTTNNADRRKHVEFTVPHFITGARYLVRADSKAVDLPGFEGMRLVSVKGTTPMNILKSNKATERLRIAVQEAPDNKGAFEMVEKSESDGFAMDDVQLAGLIATHPHPEQFKIVGSRFTVEPLAIMLQMNDPAFKAIVDGEMKRLIESREIEVLYDKWFMKPIGPTSVTLNLPMNYLLKDSWKYPSSRVDLGS